MTANEWLGVMKQAQDFPNGMEKLIVKYGEMLIAEHESKIKKLTIPDVNQQSELLNALVDGINKEFQTYAYLPDLERYIKAFNCG